MKQRKFVIEEAQILGTNYQEILRTLALKFFKKRSYTCPGTSTEV